MQQKVTSKSGLGILVSLALAMSAGLDVPAASAQALSTDTQPARAQGRSAVAMASAHPQQRARSERSAHLGTLVVTAPNQAPRVTGNQAKKKYFVEFRSRSAASYGHTFLIHGRLDGKKTITKDQVVGLHPFTESPIPWMIGHIVVVPSETGASDGDTEEEYVTARYRILLSEDEYQKVVAFMNKLKQGSPLWHAVLYNCNMFIGDIARFMGLKTPMTSMLYPDLYINGIKELNGGRQTLDPSFLATTPVSSATSQSAY